ncbi:DNA-3-methyladenine glycosylase [Alteromonas sp. BL110]|uniref:DNA-3-methyladenine glycosylase n=1 Tax=Alteromonas sp. BL110 TaxID=1714845 RepID=UPI000E49FC6C|nr:DNA-3-methyladenine glycosylase [Alteromonas sp. BL110]AXT40046.1 DNA-3-methyladenine glycosylase [Alteromonas sp. BL110]RKM79275.1 DNA-3-methyladenine glycosylase [Alteromonas sp. BL110]
MQLSSFTDSDVVNIARSLVGNFLFSRVGGALTGGMITETEAYCGQRDLAMQKHLLRRPSSVTTLEKRGGIAYIYTVYGYHSMFNIVTNVVGNTDSVLIRAISPTVGLDIMQERRGSNVAVRNLCSGPAKLSQALALTPALNGEPVVNNNTIWIESNAEFNAAESIVSAPRIGIDYAKEDKNEDRKDDKSEVHPPRDDTSLPWRFTLEQSV